MYDVFLFFIPSGTLYSLLSIIFACHGKKKQILQTFYSDNLRILLHLYDIVKKKPLNKILLKKKSLNKILIWVIQQNTLKNCSDIYNMM